MFRVMFMFIFPRSYSVASCTTSVVSLKLVNVTNPSRLFSVSRGVSCITYVTSLLPSMVAAPFTFSALSMPLMREFTFMNMRP